MTKKCQVLLNKCTVSALIGKPAGWRVNGWSIAQGREGSVGQRRLPLSADGPQGERAVSEVLTLPMPPQGAETRCILEEPLKWADGFVVVYNISDRASFSSAKDTLRQIREARVRAARGECLSR